MTFIQRYPGFSFVITSYYSHLIIPFWTRRLTNFVPFGLLAGLLGNVSHTLRLLPEPFLRLLGLPQSLLSLHLYELLRRAQGRLSLVNGQP